MSTSKSSKSIHSDAIANREFDNYYEIFVYSFCDSDDDGVGDFQGVETKLPYIKEMGYTGIWLMPICLSPSYHKYDVQDYMSVDPHYGTMRDFEHLVDEAHKLGIKVILDLVLNHTSDKHRWFLEAVKDAERGNKQGKYYNYYNFSDYNEAGYSTVGNSELFYEAQFYGGMPDLNLDNPEVRDELDKVIKFWLSKGVDGFRLDACTNFYTGDTVKSAQFVGWVKATCNKYKADTFIVGESWTTSGNIAEFYRGGGDSFFYFPMAKDDGYINQTLYADNPSDYFYHAMVELVDIAQGHIPAPFLDNHDTPRIAGVFKRDSAMIKFGYGLLNTLNGNVFTYYGDEIGMVSFYNDPDKRIGMLWDSNQKRKIAPPGVSKQEYVFGGVKQQQADANSILNYYKACNHMRLNYPAIALGEQQRVDYPDKQVLIVQKRYKQQEVVVVINFATQSKAVRWTKGGDLVVSLTVDGHKISMDNGVIDMPRNSIALIKLK